MNALEELCRSVKFFPLCWEVENVVIVIQFAKVKLFRGIILDQSKYFISTFDN